MSTIEKDVRNFLLGISEGKNAFFDGVTDKDAVSYKVGDKIIFKLRAQTQDDVLDIPYIKYSCTGDDGKKTEGTVKSADDGYFYIETSLDKCGFVRVIATALDEDFEEIKEIDIFEGGAGADIDKIECMTDIPDDYFEYWEELKKRAKSIPKEIIYEKELDVLDGYVVKDVRFKTTAGKYLSLLYTYPKNAKKSSLKLKMSFMAYGVKSCVPEGEKDTLTVLVNSHDVENMRENEYYQYERQNTYKEYGFDEEENKSPETSYWDRMFLRDMQAFYYFRDHELLNKKEYIFIGGSQGALQASNMALHSGVATEVYLRVPWSADVFAEQKIGRMGGWNPGPQNAMRYFDTAVAAHFLKCSVYIEAGLGDYICPPSGQCAMFNSMTCPRALRFVQNMTHPYRPVIRHESFLMYRIEEFKY